MNRYLRIFLRQPYTNNNIKNVPILKNIEQTIYNYDKHKLDIYPYKGVTNKDNFKEIFNIKTGCNFTPENFRNFRLNKLDNCHGMIIIRTDVSESTAFELGYLYAKYRIPVFYMIHKDCPLNTTLLKDLYPDVTYCNFINNEYKEPLIKFIDNLGRMNNILEYENI